MRTCIAVTKAPKHHKDRTPTYKSAMIVLNAFSLIVYDGALGKAPGVRGNTEPSTTRNESTKLTRNLLSTQ